MSGGEARFELDPSVRVGDRGRLLIGGTPPRLIRLSRRGAAALDSILRNGTSDAAGHALAARLEATGILHPHPDDGEADPPVTAVIPVLDAGEGLGDLVRTLAAEGPVIVVDDGSRDGSAALARAAGATVVANAGRPGPAGARNTGLLAARTEMVAFVDADCLLRSGWRRGLATLLADDPSLAIVAPRVRSAPGASRIARYERWASPLDLGPAPGLVGDRRRIAYLPAASLLTRRADLLDVGGFDESMRFGEDVDLVWRLLDAGRRIRYVPSRQVLHRPRSGARALFTQRAGYGGAAPDLGRRHRTSVGPVTIAPHPLGVWLCATLAPKMAPPALAISVALVAMRGGDRPSRIRLIEICLRGHAHSTAHLTRALLREWLPISLLMAVSSRRGRRMTAAALIVDSLLTLRDSHRSRDPLGALAVRRLDHAGYAIGLWRAAVRDGDFHALLPNWRRG